MKAIETHLIPCLIVLAIGFFCGIVIAGQCSVRGQYCFNKQHQLTDQLNRIMNGSTCPPPSY